MLHPWEMAGFRETVAREPESKRFGDFAFNYRECHFDHSAQGVVLEDPTEADYFPPERVFGCPPEPKCLDGVTVEPQRVSVPAVIIHRLERAQLVSQVAAISGSGGLFYPSSLGSETHVVTAVQRNRNGSDGFVLSERGKNMTAYFICGSTRRVYNGTAVLLHNNEPGNYGRFLVTVLPQLIYLQESGISFDYIIHTDRSPWLHSAIELLGISARPVYTIREVCGDEFASLLIFNDFSAGGMIRPHVRTRIHEALVRMAGNIRPSLRVKKLYLSRALNRIARPKYRNLINEVEEVEPLMRRYGYETYSPESLPWKDQISLMLNAKRVVGPSGSGMLNCMFAPEHTHVVDLESFTVAVRQHARVYASSGKCYAFAFGSIDPTDDNPHIPFRRWSVPRRVIDEVIDWLEAGSS